MKQRMLGKTGIEVSQLALGGLYTSSFGPGLEQTRRAVRRAVELGINYIDTAPGYVNSEAVLGNVLAGIDVPLVISTKLGGRPQPSTRKKSRALRTPVRSNSVHISCTCPNIALKDQMSRAPSGADATCQ